MATKLLSCNPILENKIAFIKSLENSGETNSKHLSNIKKALHIIIKNKLTNKQREMVTLYYFEHITMPKIADMFSLNKSTVSRHIKYARNKIKKALQYFI